MSVSHRIKTLHQGTKN